MTVPHTSSSGPAEVDADVIIVGAGPVGLTTALLLGQSGWRVIVLERFPEPYPRPRAVHFDDEVARLLALAGIDPGSGSLAEPADAYDWRNAAGETLLHFDWSGIGACGWPIATMMHQPTLENALSSAANTIGTIKILRGHDVTALEDRGDHVEVIADTAARSGHPLTASWVVGCDGANSLVRQHMATGMTDLGFVYDWLILDVIPFQPRTWAPPNLQICDPARPTTVVSGGPGRRRWEFMRLPTETVAAIDTDDTAWQLLAPWQINPRNASLERRTVYTFAARWADDWRDGRILLAGDAAHQMPPFAGQGMCSGIRDAANLSWKLDLVLRGLAGTNLLDSYTLERRAHVQHAISMSIELGKVICLTDPDAAAQRDAVMIDKHADPARILPAMPPPKLTEGLLHKSAGGTSSPGAGVLSPQPRLIYRGRTGLLDEVVGTGFLVAATENPCKTLSLGQIGFLNRIGAHVLHVIGPDNNGLSSDHVGIDVDGTYLRYLRAGHQVGVIVRPDNYLFAAASDMDQLAGQVDDLRSQLVGGPALANSRTQG